MSNGSLENIDFLRRYDSFSLFLILWAQIRRITLQRSPTNSILRLIIIFLTYEFDLQFIAISSFFNIYNCMQTVIIYSASFEFSEVHRASIMDICLFLSCDLFLRESSYYDNLARMTFLSNILHKESKVMRGNSFFSNDLIFFHET